MNVSEENIKLVSVFLKKYYNETELTELSSSYPDKRSLAISWRDMDNYNPTFAEVMIEQPETVLGWFRKVVSDWDFETGVQPKNVHVRIKGFPVIKKFSEISPECEGKLTAIQGTVIAVRRPEDKIKVAVFECPYCHHQFTVEQPPLEFKEPVVCPEEDGGCGRKGSFKLLVPQSETVKAQRITIQEPETGESREIEIEDDLVGLVTPGEAVKITGIVRYHQRKRKYEKTPYLDWHLEVNSMEPVRKRYSAETKKAARELLKDPQILDRIAEFLEKPGLVNGRRKKVIVGEQQNKRLLFLAGLSSRSERRLHVVLLGSSSAGKTRLASLLKLFFPERVKELHRTSAKALEYIGGSLDGQILLYKEMAGSKSSEYPIRITMDPESEEITVWTVVTDERTGEPQTIEKKTVGSPVFISTTTSGSFDDQIKNRAFIAVMDESEQQTRRIFEAEDRERREILPDLTGELETIQCALDMLQRVAVKIPFTVKYPAKRVKARRSRSHLLDLVEMVAFLHQYQRRWVEYENGERYVIAEPTDFEIAKNIAETSITVDIKEITPKAEKLFKLFEKEGKEGELKIGFTVKEIVEESAKYLGRRYARRSIENFLEELESAGMIVSDGGRPKKYSILEEDEGEGTENKKEETAKNGNAVIELSDAETELREWLDRIGGNGKKILHGSELLEHA